mmetsp:Transcript_11551/g.23006  ORF Transcript_11551/g.23006 Transcript_11551/m.23006 type:complete len:410 (+) Transcript_11551:53-1282(+)
MYPLTMSSSVPRAHAATIAFLVALTSTFAKSQSSESYLIRTSFVAPAPPHLQKFDSLSAGGVRAKILRPASRLVVRLSSSPEDASEASSRAELEYLRSELSSYLAARDANIAAGKCNPRYDKKVKGGSRGNAALEFVSAVTSEIIMDERERGVFDYDEISFHGFDYLVKPIMGAGGRKTMYTLMGMTPPAPPERLRSKQNPNIDIDFEGKGVKARYAGLKVGKSLDDEMGRAMDLLMKKKEEGSIGKVDNILEKFPEDKVYLRNNKGPRMTPDWTAAQLDERGRIQGRAASWVRDAKSRTIDPSEYFRLSARQQTYLCAAALATAAGYGRATPAALDALGLGDGAADPARILSLVCVFLSVGSAVSAAVLAPQRNRDKTVWGAKGLLGGPVAALELLGLGAIEADGDAA